MTQISLPTEGDAGRHMRWVQAAFSCAHCRRISVAGTIAAQDQATPSSIPTQWWDNKPLTWTPEKIGGREFPDVPDHIASAADEAFRCWSINGLRSSILLSRAVIEATCKDKGVTKGQLKTKIDDMHAKGFIRSFTQEAAHELRYLGNDMAHGDFVDEVDHDDAEAVLDVMAEILNEVYQGPARSMRMMIKRTAAREKTEGADTTPKPQIPSRSGSDFTGNGNG